MKCKQIATFNNAYERDRLINNIYAVIGEVFHFQDKFYQLSDNMFLEETTTV